MRTDVGDRHISEAINQFDYSLGGEPSGHILIPHLSKTGDALMNSLIILCELVRENKLSSNFFKKFTPIPQTIYNIKGLDKEILDKVELKEQIHRVIQKVKDDARVIVRPSGTEKIIRIMVESNNSTLIKSTIGEFEKIFSKY